MEEKTKPITCPTLLKKFRQDWINNVRMGEHVSPKTIFLGSITTKPKPPKHTIAANDVSFEPNPL